MPYVQVDGIKLYYELSGPEGGPVILQLGGGLFGRHNFGLVNDGLRAKGYRLLAFDARGYGLSDHPHEPYSIEGWADEAATLVDALELGPVFVHGTSMGGMVAIAFVANHPDKTIAACADAAFAKPDKARRVFMSVWRRMAESTPWDVWCDLITIQALAADFLETPDGENMFELVRDITGLMDPFTVRAACLAMERMDLSPLVPKISRPLLMTNGRHDIICPPQMAPSGLGALQMAELNPTVTAHVFEGVAHADLVECPAEAIDVVHRFFREALVGAG